MKVLVTGSNGFIGKHICLALSRESFEVLPFDITNTDEELKEYISKCDFIIHLAGVNRPLSNDEFYNGNTNFTKKLCDYIVSLNKSVPIIMSSSIQASLDNDYGKSKKLAEDYLLSKLDNVYIYRLSNVFGKWCRPNYNSVCATFCYNIAHNLDISVRDPNYIVHFNYIDDIVNEFISIVKGSTPKHKEGNIYKIMPTYDCSLGKLSELLYYFKEEVESDRHLPLIHSEFELKLFKTFLSYLTSDEYKYNYAVDSRGSFEELYKDSRYGQISENITNIGITKGGHYHTYKKEIFYTVIGESYIKQRNITTNEVIEDYVNGNNPKLVNIIPNYTHLIRNIGNVRSHTLMWISEIYDDKTHDTYKEEVDK